LTGDSPALEIRVHGQAVDVAPQPSKPAMIEPATLPPILASITDAAGELTVISRASRVSMMLGVEPAASQSSNTDSMSSSRHWRRTISSAISFPLLETISYGIGCASLAGSFGCRIMA
jgi:hypothetical protein